MVREGWRDRIAGALAEVAGVRGGTAAYVEAIRRLVLARADSAGQCVQEIAETLVQQLAFEACAAALADGPSGDLVLAGFATRSDRPERPPGGAGEPDWLALASLAASGPGPRWFRQRPDGSLDAISSGDFAGDGFVVLPLGAGEPGGALVLRSRGAPADAFARGRALPLLADIAGQVLALARAGEAVAGLAAGDGCRPAQASPAASPVRPDLIGTMSHELRTPLNAILGYASLLREGTAGSVTREQTALLDRVLSNTRSLNSLIDDVLLLVQLEADRVVVRRDRVRATELIDAVVAELPERTAPECVPLRVDVAPPAAILHVDATLVHRLLVHLLGNAFKFAPRAEVAVAVRPGEETGSVVIAVRDAGAGIAPERLAVIRALFAEGGPVTERRQHGFGMGLPLVHRCVRLLGGAVEVESRPGAGSEFRVRIPGALSGVDDAPAPPAAARTVH